MTGADAMRFRWWALALFTLQGACGAAARPEQHRTRPIPDAQPRVGAVRDVLTTAEIDRVNAFNGYDLVQWLRPEFLRRRAGARPTDPNGGYPVVYVDGVYQGGLEMLQLIPARAILDIRYLTAGAASEWYGSYRRGSGAVIAVRTR